MIRKLSAWWRRRRGARLDIPDALWPQVEAGLPFLGHLTPDEREHLRELARQFIAEKQWSGAQGLHLTPRIQLAIALQACLPILKLGLDWYAGWVGIVVYPGDFVIPRRMIDEDGVVHEYDDEVMGEAWYGGPVLISWYEHPEDADGINVVIHEFAHKLDMKSGDADGVPPMHSDMSRQAWIEVMSRSFDDFQRASTPARIPCSIPTARNGRPNSSPSPAKPSSKIPDLLEKRVSGGLRAVPAVLPAGPAQALALTALKKNGAARLRFVSGGVADGTRTHDNWNHNPGLYQLSYSHHRTAPTNLQAPSGRGRIMGDADKRIKQSTSLALLSAPDSRNIFAERCSAMQSTVKNNIPRRGSQQWT
jgi:Mlc titration factor MtfA (ptsG expression regulator)